MNASSPLQQDNGFCTRNVIMLFKTVSNANLDRKNKRADIKMYSVEHMYSGLVTFLFHNVFVYTIKELAHRFPR